MIDATDIDKDIKRYTRVIKDQKARDFNTMNRPFYIAGGEINGSVIQQYPGSEIMVVDFEKDGELRKFYDETLIELKKRGWGSVLLPDLLVERIRKKLKYNLNLVNGLEDGTAQSFTGEMEGISNEAKDLIKKCPKLANQKIYVGEYFKLEIGVCRQMGLIAASCLERAIQEEKAPAWKGVEYRGLFGGVDPHAFGVAEKYNGQMIAMDPANGYCGPVTEGPYPYFAGYENHVLGRPEQ